MGKHLTTKIAGIAKKKAIFLACVHVLSVAESLPYLLVDRAGGPG
jgi:hypothetical protein